MDRMKTLLENYYGVSEDGAEGGDAVRDLDSDSLNPATYVAGQLQSAGMAELLVKDDQLVQEVHTLDADMQLLVYDNYSKFISATDTIRNMKDNVDRIEGEIDSLVAKVDNIGRVAGDMNQRMAPKRSKIEKLVGLQNLIRKLNFLFDLPQRLKNCIEKGAPARAALYFKRAVPILQKHSEVASFAAIERESKQIMEELAEKLAADIEKKDTTFETFNENVTLLVDLRAEHESLDLESLGQKYLAWHQAYFDEIMNPMAMGALKSPLNHDRSVGELMTLVLSPLKQFCATYRNLFETSVQDDQEDTSAGSTELHDTAKEIITSFVNTVRTQLLHGRGSFRSPQESDNAESGESAELGETSSFKSLLENLHILISGAKGYKIDGIIRSGLLSDRVAEIAEHVIRKQVVDSFESLRSNVLQLLVDGIDKEPKENENSNSLEEAAKLSEAIQAAIQATMLQVNELLDASSEVLDEMSAIFDNLIRFQLRSWFLWLANALECACNQWHPNIRPLVAIASEQPRNPERAKITVQFPSRGPRQPNFILTVVCLTQLIRQYVRKAPYNIASAPELMNELDGTKDVVLLNYVESCANGISIKVADALVEPASNLLEASEPSAVRPFAIHLVEQISQISHRVSACMLTRSSSISSSDGKLGGSSPNSALSAQDGGSRLPSRFKTTSGVHQDIEMMFADNLHLLETIPFDPEAVCCSILVFVFKSIFEFARQTTFSKHAFQQLEVDTFFLRSVLPVVLDDVTQPISMLTNILRTAQKRTIGPSPLSQASIDRLCRESREQLQLPSK
eukprot:CAMPEP_0184532946 /NCGR_PEP_ID=MMETSP0198_2-20121128/14461_1 /TAXON_ID=1112570 /ORGANISM="Thraustochytrium sp., Strain LLF1b" /LENGTH=795 /DNA_ID=CAMNT_0026925623 /DNA_START=11 /DNA_END=2398 /DNA_ORIENTATION=+